MDIDNTLQKMLTAFSNSLQQHGIKLLPNLVDTVTKRMRAITKQIIAIAKLSAKKSITRSEAKTLYALQKEDLTEQLLTELGLMRIVLQDAINAALNVLRTAINDMLAVVI